MRDLHKNDVDRGSQAILDWLSPTNYASRQNHFISQRQEGTGLWLLNSTAFKTWVKTDNQTLFCPGIPGAGKTILSSIVVDELCGVFGNDSFVGVAYLYCDFRQNDKQRVEDLLASLLRQLSQCQPSLPQEVRSLTHRHKKKQTRPSQDDLLRTLQSLAAMYSRVFIIVDALDELTMECRVSFLPNLLALQAICGANLFVTSRFIPEIVEYFTRSTLLEIRASEHDVRRYIDAYVSHLPSFVRRSMDLQEEIKSRIVNAVDGMCVTLPVLIRNGPNVARFLLAQLHLNSLTGKRSIKRVRATLAKLVTGSDAYDHAYKEAMGRIESQLPDQVELAKQVLSWIICARRPLTTTELQHALAVEVGQPELDPENFPELEDMVSLCAGLITVDEEGGIIRLVHYTAQEYFKRTQTHWFPNAESDITAICLTYLSFSAFNSGFCQTDDEFEERLQEYVFYDYAAHNWGHHAVAAPVEVSQLTLDFLQTQSQVSASSQAMMTANDHRYDGYSQDVPRQMTGMHVAACFGLHEAIVALLAKGDEPDINDTFGRTPLSYAAERGFSTVVQLLLASGNVNPNLSDSAHQWTPLWYATAEGHEAIVELLLNNAAIEPDLGGIYRRTPLWCAVEKGHVEIATLLLEKGGADPNSRDCGHGWTPLLWAAATGHDAMVSLLLTKAEVDPDSKDSQYGRTPLSWAAERGHTGVVEQLLARDSVDPNSISRYGRTPLWFARESGQETVVQLLVMNSRANPDVEYANREEMPLWYAAERGDEAIVKLLLANGADSDCKSKYGRTPLSYSAEKGHEGIVKLLLEKDEVDPDSTDAEYGRSPLSLAAALGHETIVRLLLEAKNVSPDLKSKNGRTPLSWAARFGHEPVVRLLLARGEVDPNSMSNHGRTPLSYAAEKGHVSIVQLLLENDEVSPCLKDYEFGQAPLSWAAAKGHKAIVKLLRDKTRYRNP
jgi:ankyrin repeat protein